jgi:hypothetical protein
MTTLQVIEQIANIMISAPNYNNVVIGGNDDMTTLESVKFLCQTSIVKDWIINTTDCKNTILVY